MTVDHVLTEYEVEVERALAERRDTASRLMDLLGHEVDEYGPRVEAVRTGRVEMLLEPQVAGPIRQSLSDAIIEFEAARHRFRLALVAVGLDHGMTARQVGDAFAFSRQLASRYVKEARAKWPGLDGEGAVGQEGTDTDADARPVEGPHPAEVRPGPRRFGSELLRTRPVDDRPMT